MIDGATMLSGKPTPVFATASVREAELVTKEQTDRDTAAWDRSIDDTLVEWGKDPMALEDDDFIPPSPDVIDFACQVATELRDEGAPPPTRVVPDGEGGVSFERVDGDVSVALNIYSDRTAELLIFDNCRLRTRRRLW